MAQPSKNQLLVAALIALLATLLAVWLLWSLLMVEPAATKLCPTHAPAPTSLPLSEFGIARARKDGRNLYCMACLRKKVAVARRVRKEYRATRKRYGRPTNSIATYEPGTERSPVPPRRFSDVERVKVAIHQGWRTQKEIRRAANLGADETARLGEDEVGLAIASLLLWTREIKSRIVGDTRHYFINNQESGVGSQESDSALPARRRDVRATAGSEIASQKKWKVG
jgi:hypothetical protein